MSRRAVCDVMIFFQWAALPANEPSRIHGTLRALLNGDIRLCLDHILLDEIREVLSDEELRSYYPRQRLFNRLTAADGMSAMSLACHIFLFEKKSCPHSLDELVPDYLPQTIIDPFSSNTVQRMITMASTNDLSG